jgi:hypothetical protein
MKIIGGDANFVGGRNGTHSQCGKKSHNRNSHYHSWVNQLGRSRSSLGAFDWAFYRELRRKDDAVLA